MVPRPMLLAGLASSASAVKLLVSGFGAGDGTSIGSITTLELKTGLAHQKAGSLSTLDVSQPCGAYPTWLDLSLGNGKVVCLEEGWGKEQGGVYTVGPGKDGKFETLSSVPTEAGPVSVQFYNKKTAIAVANYAGGAITTYSASKDGTFVPIQKFQYSNETHGPKPQQDKSHVHHSVLDPTGQYLVFPDLGLDAVHVFCIDSKGNTLTAHDDIKSPAGSGPRHAAFWTSGKNTYLFVVHELSNTIISYKVNYLKNGGIKFDKVDEVSSYGDFTKGIEFGAAAEIQVSNDFVLASNRNVTIAQVDNANPSNSTKIDSDAIVTYKPSPDGKLKFVQLVPSGGKFPRHFSLNKEGTLVSVANQQSYNVIIYARDVKTGKIGDRVASAFDIGLPGAGINNVVWVE